MDHRYFFLVKFKHEKNFKGRGTWKKLFRILLKHSLGHTTHMKKFSDFLMTIVSSKLRLKLCFFNFLFASKFKAYCGCGFAYVIERMPTWAPCLLAVWQLRVPTHIATVLVCLGSLGIPAWGWNGWNKCSVLKCSGIPRRILFFAANISKKTVLSLEQISQHSLALNWPENRIQRQFPLFLWGKDRLLQILWLWRLTVDFQPLLSVKGDLLRRKNDPGLVQIVLRSCSGFNNH